jgi:hypothetical protein
VAAQYCDIRDVAGYRIVSESFAPDAQRLPVCVPYSIACVIAQNGGNGILGPLPQDVDSLVSCDLAALAIAAAV